MYIILSEERCTICTRSWPLNFCISRRTPNTYLIPGSGWAAVGLWGGGIDYLVDSTGRAVQYLYKEDIETLIEHHLLLRPSTNSSAAYPPNPLRFENLGLGVVMLGRRWPLMGEP